MAKTKEALLYLDCFLELPAEAIEIARELNREIVQRIGGAVDFSRGTIPHITLYMGLFPASEQLAITETISRCTAGTPPFPVQLGGLEVSREGYLFWPILRSEPLEDLHRRLVTQLNPLRRGAIRSKFLETIDRYSLQEQGSIRNYGFPWVLEGFSPHVTIGASTPEAALSVAGNLEPPAYSFVAQHLGLGPVGESGVVLETGSRYLLGKG